MNTYLYPWSSDEYCDIQKVIAKSLQDCERKIIEYYCNKWNDLSDTLDFEEFVDQLFEEHNIYIGNIYEIDEFM